MNGKEYGQSMAELRMLGTMYGYYNPSDWKCAYYCDVILDGWVDILDKTNGIVLSEDSEEKKKETLENVIKNIHIPFLNFMEKQLVECGGPYIAGNKLTIADCAMVATLANIWENPAGPFTERFKPVLANYPKVQAYNKTLRVAFAARLNDPARKPMPI